MHFPVGLIYHCGMFYILIGNGVNHGSFKQIDEQKTVTFPRKFVFQG
jgi:hypothetical protein